MKRKLIYICIGLPYYLPPAWLMAKDKKGIIDAALGTARRTAARRATWPSHSTCNRIRRWWTEAFLRPSAATQFSSGTFRRNMLEIHIDTPQGSYSPDGQIRKGKLSGTWASDSEKGVWEGKKQGATTK